MAIDQSKVVAGGDADPEARYVAPTILYPITWEYELMEDEIFGPIRPSRDSSKATRILYPKSRRYCASWSR